MKSEKSAVTYEGGAYKSGDQTAELVPARLAEGKLGPGILDGTDDEMLQHDRMACELPARVEPHARFRVGEHLDALGIEPVETGIGQHIPVG
jgi:hypothetical protein